MGTLSDLLKRSSRSSSKQEKIVVLTPEPEHKDLLFIPANEKPIVELFLDPMPKAVVVHEIKTYVEVDCFLRALLSKYPHYKYLCWTKRGNGQKQYWFNDTQRNIKVVMSRFEIKRKVK